MIPFFTFNPPLCVVASRVEREKRSRGNPKYIIVEVRHDLLVVDVFRLGQGRLGPTTTEARLHPGLRCKSYPAGCGVDRAHREEG